MPGLGEFPHAHPKGINTGCWAVHFCGSCVHVNARLLCFSPTSFVSGGAFLIGVGLGSESDWLGLLVFGRVAMAHIAKIADLVH